MLLTVKSFEVFPKHNGYGFALNWNWYIFVALTNKKLFLPL